MAHNITSSDIEAFKASSLEGNVEETHSKGEVMRSGGHSDEILSTFTGLANEQNKSDGISLLDTHSWNDCGQQADALGKTTMSFERCTQQLGESINNLSGNVLTYPRFEEVATTSSHNVSLGHTAVNFQDNTLSSVDNPLVIQQADTNDGAEHKSNRFGPVFQTKHPREYMSRREYKQRLERRRFRYSNLILRDNLKCPTGEGVVISHDVLTVSQGICENDSTVKKDINILQNMKIRPLHQLRQVPYNIPSTITRPNPATTLSIPSTSAVSVITTMQSVIPKPTPIRNPQNQIIPYSPFPCWLRSFLNYSFTNLQARYQHKYIELTRKECELARGMLEVSCDLLKDYREEQFELSQIRANNLGNPTLCTFLDQRLQRIHRLIVQRSGFQDRLRLIIDQKQTPP